MTEHMISAAAPVGWNPLDWWKFSFLRRFASFGGRARRREYGLAHVSFVVIFVAAGATIAVLPESAQSVVGGAWGIFIAASIIPYLALTIRRLHDIGLSGWMLLVTFIPLFGLVLQLQLFFKNGENGTTKYGPPVKLHPRALQSELAH